MSRNTDGQGHRMAVGSTGSGKTVYAVAVLKTFAAAEEREAWCTLRNDLNSTTGPGGEGEQDKRNNNE